MREAFNEALEGVSTQLVAMNHLVGSAVERATVALLDGDRELAESVITADKEIDALREALDAHVVETIARQSPVATDLRILIAGLAMASDIERMGDLAMHIAKVSRLRAPEKAVPPLLRSTFLEMGQIASSIVSEAGSVIAGKDLEGAVALEAKDDRMDELHRSVFRILRSDAWDGTVEQAVDATLLSRYYERYADHAVAVARRVVYLVTGEWMSDTDTYRGANPGVVTEQG